MPDVREKSVQNGSEPTGTSLEEFRAIMQEIVQNFARLIQQSGAKPQ